MSVGVSLQARGQSRLKRHLGALCAAVLLLPLPIVAQPISGLLPDGTLVAGRCDRGCMVAIVEGYLTALVSHDRGKVLWSTLPKYTEDGTELQPGEGTLWQATTALGKYRNYVVDVKGGQVGLLSVVYQGPAPLLIALRLRLVGRRISEVEAITADRTGGAAALEAKGAPSELFSEVLNPDQRSRREQLIAAADAYFTGLEQSNGDMIPLAPDCNRVENGGLTTNLADLSSAPFDLPGAESWRKNFSRGCRDQINSGMFGYITEIRNRRYEIIDEERGNILSFVIFDHPGDVKAVQLPGQAAITIPAAVRRSFDTYVAEDFHIRAGQIHQIEAVIHPGNLGMTSGWPDRPRLDH